MTSSDKDFRFMATNDLMTELQKDSIKLDDDSERKVVRMILKLLEDKNGEVQNLAVKCLGPLVSKVKEYQVETIVDTLCTNMLSDKEQLRDISSIGLKTVIGELPPASSGSALAASVCKKITGRLTSAIAKQEDVSVQLEALDIMADMLCRQGGLLVNFHPSILSCLLPQLTSPRLAVRKRTIMALGHLVMSCGNLVFIDLIEHLLTELGRNDNMSTTRTYIQCTAAISRQAGHRIDDDELREYCIQAFESFVRRCPKEVYPHVPTVISICLRYLTYDPNYNFDDEDEDDNAMDAEQNDEDYQGSDDEYSDDDDMSWKVRRAAAKCLDAVVSTRHEMLPEFYRSVSPALVCRFKTRPAQSWLADPDAMEQGETPLTMLQSQVPMIVKALHKQLKEKSVKTRQCCFNMLTELVNVLPGALTQHIPVLIPGIIFSLNDKSSSSNLKIDALACLHVIMVTHPAHAFHAHVPALVPPVVACVGDPFYKITSEALLVTQQLVKVIRPLDNQSEGPDSFDPSPYINDLFTCTIKRLKAADIDQEVKERAISCMGQIICNLGDRLPAELPGTLLIFLERLKNEITRLTTVKALTLIAGSPLKIDLRPVLPDAVPILASFLRKNQRALKLCTLAALDILLRNYSSAVTPVMVDAVLAELPPLISESDMHVSQMALSFLSTLAVTHPSSLGQLSGGNILQQLIALVGHHVDLSSQPELKTVILDAFSSSSEEVKSAASYALGSIAPQPIDPLLKNCIGDFLKTLEDPDLNVRRVALVTFNSAAHNKPSLIRELLDSVLPQLYNETKVRKELIREVEMGPFKHTVDDGLDLRKAAFECMYTLLDSCLDRIDIFTFLNHVEDGLKDHYDIKVKANSVKQEFEKQDELKRSAMRAVVALLTIPEAEKSPLMSEFQSQISSNQELAAIFDSIQRDSSSANMESMDTS
ncbi:Cullin-associated NEDD8-dissociated protein 1 [Larimichthys crocea]|uniref:Uncharacterized protein n=1 Tax=Larimichthys crocea TaxID=215358 RepID=A0ACD3Q659_LARCR|nr:Cullin-associated NEDD8-dissociated protein 1 [Larimichthys crocea]